MKPRIGYHVILNRAKAVGNAEFKRPAQIPADVGIAGSTFRAFRTSGLQPSKLYRKWTSTKAKKIIQRKKKWESRKDFLELHSELAASWAALWNLRAARPIKVSEKYKIVDLFVKALAFTKGHEFEKCRGFFYKFGNIPLDKFSLLLIRDIFVGIILTDSPRMGDIKDKETYDYLQKVLFDLSSSARVPNLALDIYAWNSKHRKNSGRYQS
jgi:hypothetical protein